MNIKEQAPREKLRNLLMDLRKARGFRNMGAMAVALRVAKADLCGWMSMKTFPTKRRLLALPISDDATKKALWCEFSGATRKLPRDSRAIMIATASKVAAKLERLGDKNWTEEDYWAWDCTEYILNGHKRGSEPAQKVKKDPP